jgi:hypothetical protein
MHSIAQPPPNDVDIQSFAVFNALTAILPGISRHLPRISATTIIGIPSSSSATRDLGVGRYQHPERLCASFRLPGARRPLFSSDLPVANMPGAMIVWRVAARTAHGDEAAFQPGGHRLRALAVVCWEGFVYVTLAQHPATFLPETLAPLRDNVVGR